MKITFVSPPLNLGGGTRVIAIYAEQLQRRGHEVVVVSPAHEAPRRSLRDLLTGRRPSPVRQPPSHFDGSPVRLTTLTDHRPVRDADVEPADAVIATWWETAEWVDALSPRAGEKFYFIQHHEVHDYLPKDRAEASYRLPLHKIVIARWLADTMAELYGDRDVDVVPNSVDHAQFHAPPRGKQAVPTVGLLYSGIYWKRFALALETLKRVRQRIGNLHVHCFGSEHPGEPLPDFVRFTFNPPQETLRDIYASCDVWLTASSTEGFNLPAMEAMACRTPVVSTRTGWPAEAIVNGVNGACVDVDDIEALASATEGLLLSSDDAWRRTSLQAFETVRTSSWERSTEQFEAALRRRVNKRTIHEPAIVG